MSASENKKQDLDNKIKYQNRLTRLGSAFYRPWAANSDREGFVLCVWCNSEFLTSNATGKKGHEESDRHKKFEEKYKANLQTATSNIEKERQYLSRIQENLENIKLFEYKLLNLCLSKKNLAFSSLLI